MKLTEREEYLLKHTFLDYQQTSEFIKNPVIFERAEGLYYWDRDGKRYFDGIGGIFVAVLGHRHPRVLEAVRRQMDRMTFTPRPRTYLCRKSSGLCGRHCRNRGNCGKAAR